MRRPKWTKAIRPFDRTTRFSISFALAQLAWLPVDNSNFCASGVSGINGLGGPER